MGNRRFVGVAAGTAAAVLLVGGLGTAAYAEDARSTVLLALSSLGVAASEELVDDLAGKELLDDALNEEVADGDALTDEESLEESFLAWNERAELWRTAFAEVKDEFDACRTEGEAEGGSGDCAVAFSGQLQVAFAETLVEFLESQSAAIAALPEDERAAAQAKLDKRLDRALEKLDRTQERVEARDATRFDRESGGEESVEGDASARSTGKPDHAGKPGRK